MVWESPPAGPSQPVLTGRQENVTAWELPTAVLGMSRGSAWDSLHESTSGEGLQFAMENHQL